RIVGLSKIARLVEMYSRRLQVQERLTNEIAHVLEKVLQPRGVAVILDAQHLCMMMRGVQKQNSYATTSAMLGEFESDPTPGAALSHLPAARLRAQLPTATPATPGRVPARVVAGDPGHVCKTASAGSCRLRGVRESAASPRSGTRMSRKKIS